MSACKIVITMEGGCIQSIHSNHDDVEVEIVDMEELEEAKMDHDQRYEVYEEHTEGLRPVENWGNIRPKGK